jgi:prepilin peptidase CpaA
MMPTVVFVIAVGLFTTLAAVVDLRMHRIPNYLTVPTAVLGIAYHTFAPAGLGMLAGLAGFAVGFGLLLIPGLLGGGGMGDVKLLAALGAWLGPIMMLIAFAVSIVFAALLALAIVINSAMTWGVLKTERRFLASRRPRNKSGQRRPARVLPFAIPVAMGTWALLAWMLVVGGV